MSRSSLLRRMQSDGVLSPWPPRRCKFLESDNVMQNIEIRFDGAIWASTIFPEGIVQRSFIADGALAETGAKIAEIRADGALHEIISPASGRLTIVAAVNDVVEPGFLLATLAVASIDIHADY
jgi:hypothetical protein